MGFSRSTIALVALNAAWLAALSYFIAHWAGQRDTARVEYVTNYISIAKAPRVTTVVTNIIAGTNDFRWAQLESEDYRTYIERLRSIGCPESTIRDIIIADVDKLLAPRFAESAVHPASLNYWEPFDPAAWDDTAERQALANQRLLDFHKREVIRQLLGVDLVGERLKALGQHDYHGSRLQFLPEEKRAQVRLVIDEFGDKERALLEQQVEEGASVEITAELQQIRASRDSALSQFLSAAEREQYDLWFSAAAARTRESIVGMNATEEEFLKLYKLRREFDARNPGGSEDDLAKNIEQALGNERFAEYTRAQDPVYRELVGVAKRHGLPPQVAVDLHGYKKTAEEQRSLVAADPALTLEQKQAAERAIAEETEAAFKEALGEKAYKLFSRRSMLR
jgi:hypothetical protein